MVTLKRCLGTFPAITYLQKDSIQIQFKLQLSNKPFLYIFWSHQICSNSPHHNRHLSKNKIFPHFSSLSQTTTTHHTTPLTIIIITHKVWSSHVDFVCRRVCVPYYHSLMKKYLHFFTFLFLLLITHSPHLHHFLPFYSHLRIHYFIHLIPTYLPIHKNLIIWYQTKLYQILFSFHLESNILIIISYIWLFFSFLSFLKSKARSQCTLHYANAFFSDSEWEWQLRVSLFSD